jgi:exopolyphosphatase/guanosine-5'-triphosphate,3'-diphosphate pyrophosphatase
MNAPSSTNTDNNLVAIDLGSNSFHMIIVRVDAENNIQVLDKIKEMVRLGEGLTAKNNISKSVQKRALACLSRFAQRIRHINSQNIKIVGTNTLRVANNSAGFIEKAQHILGADIEVISGMEEARLIYLGVSHTLAGQGKKRLVVDIGGGSTETIIGEKFEPQKLESLAMGCVSFSRKYFPDGILTESRIHKAELAAELKTEGISRQFINAGWKSSVGASGTIKSIARIAQENGLCDDGINTGALDFIRQSLIDAGSIDNIQLKGLSDDRKAVIAGGFIVLQAIFRAFNIRHMAVSDGAVREGLIYEMIGRIRHEDVREKSVYRLQSLYSVDAAHAQSVEETCEAIYNSIATKWGIEDEENFNLLNWASRVHEIGLTVSHNRYTEHGAYIVQHSDMYGFTLTEQAILAVLVRHHRGKFSRSAFKILPPRKRKSIKRLCIILRLAVILQRSRTYTDFPDLEFSGKKKSFTISCPTDWFEQHPLTIKDLRDEKKRLKQAIDYKLKIRTI